MDAHDIILAEWRESVKACIEGNDPLEKPGGIGAYMQQFPGHKSLHPGPVKRWIDPYDRG